MDTEILISIITRHAFWKVKIDEKDSSVKKYIKPRTCEKFVDRVNDTHHNQVQIRLLAEKKSLLFQIRRYCL